MKTLSNIEKRISTLEESGDSEDRLITLFVVEEGDKENADYLYHRCEDCCDSELLEDVVGGILKEETGDNPFKEHGIRFAKISKEIMLNAIELLREKHGIEVSLNSATGTTSALKM